MTKKEFSNIKADINNIISKLAAANTNAEVGNAISELELAQDWLDDAAEDAE